MKVDYHKGFKKEFKKLRVGEKKRVMEALMLFKNTPYDPCLKNHALKGEKKGRRAIWAGGDLRIVFKEYNDYVFVLFLQVGSHNQVY